MGRTIAEALIAEGEERGRLSDRRATLRLVLETRVGPLPEAVVQRINAIEQLDSLAELIRQASTLEHLEDLHW